ncbi:toprim domain-containing protein [Parabacteroides chinchillae]
MTIEEAKNIKLADYLHSLGYNPVKQQGNNLWYKSPFREEKDPSFKVNPDRNLWYDFGMGTGGNIITLAQELYASDSLPYLLDRIAEQSPSIRPVSFSFRKQSSTQPSFQQLEVVPLSSIALYSYLQGRGINTELAKKECKEIRFVNNGKQFFAVGFPNISGGYEIRNKYFKGCIAPKDITHIRQQGEPRETCYVFEGFMDYLSFLTLRQKSCPDYPDLDKQDYLVLNSVSNLSKALYPLGSYEKIHCFFDNDEAGMKAVRALYEEYSFRVRDSSHIYSGYKDLNDYITGKKQVQSVDLSKSAKQTQQAKPVERQEQQPAKKKSRGFRM